ncbi:MAG: hypothetical protein KC491_04435 [Dehalococcoidia bacterium]|nr:hypothetical protein [Dehalococcoidia bacterium]
MRLATFAVFLLLGAVLVVPRPAAADAASSGSSRLQPLAEQAAQPVPPELVSFGQAIAADLRAGRNHDLASRFLPVPVTCPQFQVDDTLIPLCKGVEEGVTVSGCLSGRIAGGAGWLDCEGSLPASLSSLAAQEGFRSSAFRLYTVALSGLDVGTLACPECAMLVFSTPADAEFDTEPAQPGVEANIVQFQVIDSPAGMRIHSYAVGHIWSNTTDFAILNGGVVEGRTFFAVDTLGPPATGTGVATGAPIRSWALMLIGTAAIAAASGLFAAGRRPD